MKYIEWEPLYKKILADFSFSQDEDIQSATVLNTILSNHPHYKPLSSLRSLLKNNSVVVIGAASQISSQINQHKTLIKTSISICADGATTALIKDNIIPTLIVTDLDGIISDQLYSNTKGSILVVHAHGDNIETIKSVVPTISHRVCGTIQTDPTMLSYVDNVGGFTDGDRAVFLADHFDASPIYLLGFDFHGPIGKFSNPTEKNLKIKRKKLAWAERLINHINTKGHIHVL